MRGIAALLEKTIVIGGLATVAPEPRGEIVGLGIKNLLAGTLATCMTGAVIGVLQ